MILLICWLTTQIFQKVILLMMNIYQMLKLLPQTFDLKDIKNELAQASLVTINQLLRSRRCPDVQCLDVACKTNNQSRLLAYSTCVDSEGKNAITQTSLVASEKEVEFVFAVVSIGFLFAISCLRSVSIFMSDGDQQIIATVWRFIAIGVLNLRTKWKL